MSPPNHIRAFSLIEVLVCLSSIGLLASIGYVAFGDVTRSNRVSKLSADAESLNRSVQAYLSAGGSIADAQTGDEVIARLKSVANPELAQRLPGLSSRLVDPRLSIRMQDIREAQSGGMRVTWNLAKARFVVGKSGDPGIKEFFLDDDLAEATPETDDREASLLYSRDSTWIWDYQDRSLPLAQSGPTPIAVGSDSPSSVVPASTVPTPPPPPVPSPPMAGTLRPPLFATPGGSYPIRSFEMEVVVLNPNAAGTSKLVYAIDYGAWIDYVGPVNVPPGSVLSAQSVALAPEWVDSRKVDQTYGAIPGTLDPPTIITTRDSFGYLYGRTITVSLTNPNPAGVSSLRYRLNGGDWNPYSGPFTASRTDYPSGLRIEAEAIPSGSPYWLASSVSSRDLAVSGFQLVGQTTGAFFDPLGSAGLVSNLIETGQAESSYFNWGDATPRPGETFPMVRNSLEFTGQSFATTQEGTRFEIGRLDYFNGLTYNYDAATGTLTTTAHGVSFGLDIEMVVDGVLLSTRFTFDFELVNVENMWDPANPWQDADFVRVSSPVAVERLLIDDRYYDFSLEFGESTAEGFATFDEFHVLELAAAGVTVYGTFSEVLFPPLPSK